MMEARTLHAGEAAEREDDAALVFPQDANGRGEEYDHDHRERRIDQIIKHHDAPPSPAVSTGRRRTTSVKFVMLATRPSLQA